MESILVIESSVLGVTVKDVYMVSSSLHLVFVVALLTTVNQTYMA